MRVSNICQPCATVELCLHISDLAVGCNREGVDAFDFILTGTNPSGDPTPGDFGTGVEDLQGRHTRDCPLGCLSTDECALAIKCGTINLQQC